MLYDYNVKRNKNRKYIFYIMKDAFFLLPAQDDGKQPPHNESSRVPRVLATSNMTLKPSLFQFMKKEKGNYS